MLLKLLKICVLFVLLLSFSPEAQAEVSSQNLETGAINKSPFPNTSIEVGKGEYPPGMFYDPTGLIIGFDLLSLCEAIINATGIGDTVDVEELCELFYNCYIKGADGKRFDPQSCPITRCFNAITKPANDSLNKYGKTKAGNIANTCAFICNLDPNDEMCEPLRCVNELMCDTNPGFNPANGIWPPAATPCPKPIPPSQGESIFGLELGFWIPNPHCCAVLTSPLDLLDDAGVKIPVADVAPQDLIQMACELGAGVKACVNALDDQYGKDGDGNSTFLEKFLNSEVSLVSGSVKTACCSLSDNDLIASSLGEGIDIMCNWVQVANCAASVGVSINGAIGDIKDNQQGSFITGIENSLGSGEASVATECCSGPNQKRITKAWGAIENDLAKACSGINALQCLITLTQGAKDAASQETNCKCDKKLNQVSEFIDGPGQTCDYRIADDAEDNGCPIDKNGNRSHCTVCNYGDSQTGNFIANLLGDNTAVGNIMNSMLGGSYADRLQATCCGPQTIGAVSDLTGCEAQNPHSGGCKAVNVLNEVCAYLTSLQCVVAISDDLFFNTNPTTESSTTLDLVQAMAKIDTYLDPGKISTLITNALTNTREKCCSSDYIVNADNSTHSSGVGILDANTVETLRTVCAIPQVSDCVNALTVLVPSIRPIPGSTENKTEECTKDDVRVTFGEIINIVGSGDIKGLMNIASKNRVTYIQNACCNPGSGIGLTDVKRAGDIIVDGFGDFVDEVCSYSSLAACSRALADNLFPGGNNDAIDADGILPNSPANVSVVEGWFPPPPTVQQFCCGIDPLTGGGGGNFDAIDMVKDLSQPLGEALENACMLTRVLDCGVAIGRAYGCPNTAHIKETPQKEFRCTNGARKNEPCDENADIDTACPPAEQKTIRKTEKEGSTIDACTVTSKVETVTTPPAECKEFPATTGEDKDTLKCIATTDRSTLGNFFDNFDSSNPDFKDKCCQTNLSVVFDHYERLIFGEPLPAPQDRIGYFLERACNALTLGECIASISTTSGADLLDGATQDNGSGDVDASWFINLIDGLNNSETSQVNNACCNGDLAAVANTVDPSYDENANPKKDGFIGKGINAMCGAIDILHCVDAAKAAGGDLFASGGDLFDTFENLLTEFDAGDLRDALFTVFGDQKFEAFNTHCCKGKVREYVGAILPGATGDVYNGMCKMMEVSKCTIGLATTAISGVQAFADGEDLKDVIPFRMGTTPPTELSLDGTIPQKVANFANFIQANAPSFDDNIRAACCDGETIMSLPDQLAAPVGVLCGGIGFGGECGTPSLAACIVSATENNTGFDIVPGKIPFMMKGCCAVLAQANIPGMTCQEPRLESKCFDVVGGIDPRGIPCQYVLKPNIATIEGCEKYVGSTVPTFNESNCDCCEAGTTQWYDKLLNCTTGGCIYNGGGASTGCQRAADCQGCTVDNLHAKRRAYEANSSLWSTAPAGAPNAICDINYTVSDPLPTSDPNYKGSNCKPYEWDTICSECRTWGGNPPSSTNKVCDFRKRKCVWRDPFCYPNGIVVGDPTGGRNPLCGTL